jgi:AcrR family transcriptional regulator
VAPGRVEAAGPADAPTAEPQPPRSQGTRETPNGSASGGTRARPSGPEPGGTRTRPGGDRAPRNGAAPRGGRRERTKAANRAAILDAARQVFAERGYDGSAVRHIVALTELAPGTFYNYFPDKESIFRALVEESIAVVRARLREARRDARDLEEFVGGAYRAYFTAMADDPVMFQLMRRNAGTIRAMLDDPVLAAGVDELLEDLEGAIERGELPPLDARYMARAMAGAGLEIAMEMFERDGAGADAAGRAAPGTEGADAAGRAAPGAEGADAAGRAAPDVAGAAAFATSLFLGGIERMALDFKRT